MKSLTTFVLLNSLLIFQPQSEASYMAPEMIPAERLIENMTAYIAQHPDNAEAHYSLGRVHYVTFMNKIGYVGAYYPIPDSEKFSFDNDDSPTPEEDSLPFDVPDRFLDSSTRDTRASRAEKEVAEEMGGIKRRWREKKWDKYDTAVEIRIKELEAKGFPPELDQKKMLEHVSKAVKHLEKSIALEGDSGLYHLTLASLLKQYTERKAEFSEALIPEPLKKISTEQILSLFYTAYEKSHEQDLIEVKDGGFMFGLDDSVAFEAASTYLEILKDENYDDEKTKVRAQNIQKFIKKMKRSRKSFAITPIIFTLTPHTTINDLLQPTHSVTFDLDGDKTAEAWPWLKPTTALLVRDPDHTGIITSGRQLFGTATWWMLFKDGYRALQSLDNNQDGALTDDELEGIAAWFDHNSDGISQPGEMTPLRELGITSFATTPTGETQGMLMNAQGITLEDGQTLPSYDWVTQPVDKAVTLPLRLH